MENIEIPKPEQSLEGLVKKIKSKPAMYKYESETYYSERIVDDKIWRVNDLKKIVADYAHKFIQDPDKQVEFAKKMFDLVIYKCGGKIFDQPYLTGDFIGAVQDEEDSENKKYKNCIMLVEVDMNAGTGKPPKWVIALVGGFIEIGESAANAIGRETGEEANAVPKDIAFVGQISDKDRDPRFHVATTVAAGCVYAQDIKADSDARRAFVVRLINEDGSLNTDLFNSDKELFDLKSGEKIEHREFRADHAKILRHFYKYWELYGKQDGLDLIGTLQKMAECVPQEWFGKYTSHEGPEKELAIDVGDDKLLMTKNIKNALEHMGTILAEYGVEKVDDLAKKMAMEMVKADILPLYQTSTLTMDCVCFDEYKNDDYIIAIQQDGGTYKLPGAIYRSSYEKGVTQAMGELMDSKYGMKVNLCVYGGAVGGKDVLGKQADDRYPRISQVYYAVLNNKDGCIGKTIEGVGKLVRVPVWKNKTSGELSDEIVNNKWEFDHNKEIIKTLVKRYLQTMDPKKKMKAVDLIERYRLMYE